jgi:hypothetical protein
MMKTRLILLLALAPVLADDHLQAAEWYRWTVSETRHPLRSEPPGQGLAVKISAGQVGRPHEGGHGIAPPNRVAQPVLAMPGGPAGTGSFRAAGPAPAIHPPRL